MCGALPPLPPLIQIIGTWHARICERSPSRYCTLLHARAGRGGGGGRSPRARALTERARFNRTLHLTTVRNEAAYYSCVCQHTQCVMDGIMAPAGGGAGAAGGGEGAAGSGEGAAGGGEGAAGGGEGAAGGGEGAAGGGGGGYWPSVAALRAALPGTARSRGALGLGPRLTPVVWAAPPIFVCGVRARAAPSAAVDCTWCVARR